VEVIVWRAGALFHARRADGGREPQVCVGVDLFEVIAELSGLDLERLEHAREALRLASAAQTELKSS
jgi:hypothetical protein